MTPTRQRMFIFGLIVLGILFAGYFGMRSLHAFREFRGHRPPPLPAAESQMIETDPELIRAWMTIPYISITYDLHPKVLFEALDIPPQGNEEKSLEELNEEYYPEAPGIVLELVKAAVRANQPAPTGIPPLTPLAPLTPVPANP
jgi:hypothetical protein